jgi:hypothetical protein
MPSPFPGMNPYLEQPAGWQDFHNTFLIAVREELAPQLRPDYFARVEEHVYIHEYGTDDRRPLGRPDVSVHTTGPGPHDAGTAGPSGDPAAPAAVLIPPGADEVRSVYLEIRDRGRREVVTVIELLSPSNKETGPYRDVYWNKVRQVLASPTHFVEIDLLRGGPRMPWVGLPDCAYYALVSRYETRPKADVWPVGLREPLPQIPIPLKSGGPKVVVDLQAVLHRVYDAAGYAISIYEDEPVPPLAPADAVWASQLLTPPA